MPFNVPKKARKCTPIRYRVVPKGDNKFLLIKVCKEHGVRGGRTHAELVKFKPHRKKGESPFIVLKR